MYFLVTNHSILLYLPHQFTICFQISSNNMFFFFNHTSIFSLLFNFTWTLWKLTHSCSKHNHTLQSILCQLSLNKKLGRRKKKLWKIWYWWPEQSRNMFGGVLKCLKTIEWWLSLYIDTSFQDWLCCFHWQKGFHHCVLALAILYFKLYVHGGFGCMYAIYDTCVPGSHRGQKGIGSPGTELTESHKLPCQGLT